MTPQEAADLVVTCTATGQSGLPLWEYLPGTQIVSALSQDRPDWHRPGRVYEAGLVESTGFAYVKFAARTLTQPEIHDTHVVEQCFVRPDFTDALTVQALWLLVRRAYYAANISLTLIAHASGGGHLRIGCADTWTERHDEVPDYAVFTRALQKAPTR